VHLKACTAPLEPATSFHVFIIISIFLAKIATAYKSAPIVQPLCFRLIPLCRDLFLHHCMCLRCNVCTWLVNQLLSLRLISQNQSNFKELNILPFFNRHSLVPIRGKETPKVLEIMFWGRFEDGFFGQSRYIVRSYLELIRFQPDHITRRMLISICAHSVSLTTCWVWEVAGIPGIINWELQFLVLVGVPGHLLPDKMWHLNYAHAEFTNFKIWYRRGTANTYTVDLHAL